MQSRKEEIIYKTKIANTYNRYDITQYTLQTKLQRLLNTTKIKMQDIEGKQSYIQSTIMFVKFCNLAKRSFC